MAISKKLRFEIFKRDNFTCQYCGRQTPDVILEVDHISPKAKGGDDDIQNLITSCFDCNHGKGITPLNSTNGSKEFLKIERALGKQNNELVRLTEYGRESCRKFLQIFPVSKIIKAINMAQAQIQNPNDITDIFEYVCRILHHWRREQNISW